MSKDGPSIARWAFSIMADTAMGYNPTLMLYHLSVKRRKGSGGLAHVVTSRKLVGMIYHMLKEMEEKKKGRKQKENDALVPLQRQAKPERLPENDAPSPTTTKLKRRGDESKNHATAAIPNRPPTAINMDIVQKMAC